jgi:hypothetical protein
MDVLDVWYARLDDSDVLAMLPQGRKALLSVRMPRPVTLGDQRVSREERPVRRSNGDIPDLAVPVRPSDSTAGFGRRAGAFLLREFREILPLTIFFSSASI